MHSGSRNLPKKMGKDINYKYPEGKKRICTRSRGNYGLRSIDEASDRQHTRIGAEEEDSLIEGRRASLGRREARRRPRGAEETREKGADRGALTCTIPPPPPRELHSLKCQLPNPSLPS
ncbi:hypothetical protein BHM03_00048440 [Ensete ventricosum]|nr:hypothetical protein BHM03_00048440 [Ensete ventricosum]